MSPLHQTPPKPMSHPRSQNIYTIYYFEGRPNFTSRSSPGHPRDAAVVPLFRFVALSLAAILALGYLGRWKAALTAAVLIIGSLVSYGAIMSHMGLPMLPSSVLLKSGAADAVVGSRGIFSIAISTMKNFYHTLWNSQGICLLFVILLMFRAWATATPGPHRRNITIIASVASFTLLAHMLGGSYDWFSRYEVYVIALGLLATLYTASKPVQEFVALLAWNAQIIVLASVAILVSHYFITALLTPFASRGVYEQQFQMHRFAADFYNKPVAVNDLGWVSYNNDNFVLDLYGLGSEPVRLMKMKHEFSPAKMAELAAHYGVGVVMIYEGWFNNLPPSWRRIAILHTQAVSAASDDVSFFVTPTADLGLVKQALANFQASLPCRSPGKSVNSEDINLFAGRARRNIVELRCPHPRHKANRKQNVRIRSDSLDHMPCASAGAGSSLGAVSSGSTMKWIGTLCNFSNTSVPSTIKSSVRALVIFLNRN